MELFTFQKEAVQIGIHFLNENKSFYNASEMGCGKTVQTIAILNHFSAASHLIVTTSSMLFTWYRELQDWSTVPYPDATLIVREKKQIPLVKDYSRIIVSYGLLSKYKEVFEKKKFDFLILDESHKVKTPKTLRTKACLGKLWDSSKYKIALSGTPFTTCVTDGFTLFNRMAPDLFPDYYKFANRYAYARESQWGTKYEGVRNTDELSRYIRNRFYVRYTKDEVLKDLPEKNFIRITLPREYAYKVPRSDEEKLKASVNAMLKTIADNGSVPVLPEYMASERRLQGRLKVKPIIEYVEDLLEQDLPVVLFAYHRDVIADYLSVLSKYRPALITGDTPPKARMLMVKDFQEGKTNLFVGQIIAAGTGITLTRSCNVVLAELTYTPAEVAQAVDRCHRIGQRDTVNVHYFTVTGSIDERIVDVIVRKARDFRKVLDEKPAPAKASC